MKSENMPEYGGNYAKIERIEVILPSGDIALDIRKKPL